MKARTHEAKAALVELRQEGRVLKARKQDATEVVAWRDPDGRRCIGLDSAVNSFEQRGITITSADLDLLRSGVRDFFDMTEEETAPAVSKRGRYVRVRLSEEEERRLKAQAKQMRLSVSEMIRRLCGL